jgi:hypothetical protein
MLTRRDGKTLSSLMMRILVRYERSIVQVCPTEEGAEQLAETLRTWVAAGLSVDEVSNVVRPYPSFGPRPTSGSFSFSWCNAGPDDPVYTFEARWTRPQPGRETDPNWLRLGYLLQGYAAAAMGDMLVAYHRRLTTRHLDPTTGEEMAFMDPAIMAEVVAPVALAVELDHWFPRACAELRLAKQAGWIRDRTAHWRRLAERRAEEAAIEHQIEERRRKGVRLLETAMRTRLFSGVWETRDFLQTNFVNML